MGQCLSFLSMCRIQRGHHKNGACQSPHLFLVSTECKHYEHPKWKTISKLVAWSALLWKGLFLGCCHIAAKRLLSVQIQLWCDSMSQLPKQGCANAQATFLPRKLQILANQELLNSLNELISSPFKQQWWNSALDKDHEQQLGTTRDRGACFWAQLFVAAFQVGSIASTGRYQFLIFLTELQHYSTRPRKLRLIAPACAYSPTLRRSPG